MLQRIIKKILSIYTLVRFGNVPKELKYFYIDTYYCKLVQLKFWFKDYLVRKEYKEISFEGEFGQELSFVLPHAYWHYKNGTLKTTESATLTKELYFFSSDHRESFNYRTNEGNYNFNIPRIIYSHDYDISKWLAVPLKKYYKNEVYVYDKPILIIANRFNSEWDGPPISFYSIDLLNYIVSSLRDKYTIIYNRPKPKNITEDNSQIYDLNDYEWLAECYPEVILLEDLYAENKAQANNFNHLQLLVYANSENFISIHGGTACLASYFGGTNLILSKKGPEHYFKCYEKLFPQFSGAKILHAKTDEEVKAYVSQYY